MKSALDKKGEEVKSHVKTIRRFEPKFKEAVGDRGSFESQRDQALKAKEKIQKDLHRSEAQVQKLAEEKQQLEKSLRGLMNGGDADVAAAAQRELDLKVAQDKVAALERQVTTTQKDMTFAQSRYQDASDQAFSHKQENESLQLKVADLEVRAGANVVEIRRHNAARTDAQLRRMYEQEKAMRLDREREIDRKNEEMRSYKQRFGGRETRGSSVPRSPRVRQMSSRNTSPVGDNGGTGGNGNGGLGGSLFGPRGSHLREL